MADEIKSGSKRGFASMSPEKRREIARLGGRSVPKEKRAFAVNPDMAREAGRKGGLSTPAEKRAYFRNKDLAIASGRKGGAARKDDDLE